MMRQDPLASTLPLSLPTSCSSAGGSGGSQNCSVVEARGSRQVAVEGRIFQNDFSLAQFEIGCLCPKLFVLHDISQISQALRMVEDKRANSTELYDIVPELHFMVVGFQKVQSYWNWELVLKLQYSWTLTFSSKEIYLHCFYVKEPKKLSPRAKVGACHLHLLLRLL